MTPWFPTSGCPINGTFVADQARALAAHHDVSVLYMQDAADGTNDAGSVLDGGPGIRITTRRVPARQRLHFLDYARAIARETRAARCDVVHAHVTVPTGFGSAVASLWTHTPLVITEHRSPFNAFLETWRDRVKVRFALRWADAIIAVSEGLKADMREWADGRQIEVVGNLISTRLFSFVPRRQRPALDRLLLFVGRLNSPQKDLPCLLQALRELRRSSALAYKLLVIGGGPLLAGLKRLASDLGVADGCEFAGEKDSASVAGALAECDMLVLPSQHETFGIVVAEAMGVGRPVVVTRCGGPEELVTPESGLVVPVGDHVALAKAIEAVASNLDRFDPLQISTAAHKRFGEATVVETLLEIYEAASSHRARRNSTVQRRETTA